MSDDILTDNTAAAAAAAAAPEASSSVPEASSVNKSNPHPSAALLSAEIFDILQGYCGTLGQSVCVICGINMQPVFHQKISNTEK